MIRISPILSFKTLLVLVLCGAPCLNKIYAQNLLSQSGVNFAAESSGEVFTETIKIISRSGKIFILTNGNQLLNKGDFITLILKDDGPVARAVVAKIHDGSAGIKVLKVYSLTKWKKLTKGLDIQLLKGDDTALFKTTNNETEEAAPETTIESEEDLFNSKDVDLSDDLGDIYNDKRLIKPDNIISAGYNRKNIKNEITGDTVAGNQFYFGWAYQFSDNYWAEAIYGNTSYDNVPNTGLQTIAHNFTIRAKYTFKAPFYSYLLPYVGFQTFLVSSSDEDQSNVPSTNSAEAATLKALRISQVVIGLTYVKRLVPGWFVKADIGNDIIGVGVAIEF